jgi:tetratricopeptide (TPR) repeat protein
MTLFVTVAALALLGGAGWFGLQAVSMRNVVKGEQYLSDENYLDAKDCFEKADRYSLRPNARVLKGLGQTYLALEDYDSAKNTYVKLVQLDPKDAMAHYALGQLFIRAKDFGGAAQQAKELRQIGSQEALDYASQLEQQSQTGMVKGFFKNILKQIFPNFMGDTPVKPAPENGASHDNSMSDDHKDEDSKN